MKHALAFFGLVALIAACSSHDLGQDCRTLGSTSECVDGTICATNVIDQLVCAKTCHVYTDCSAAQDCVPVGGSGSSACRTR